ncbi:MAG: diguanylate cyclase domain-containing protein [Massiliimalia sp.]
MKPVYALMNLGVCYIIFVVFLSTQFGLKEVIHFSLMVLLCGIVSWARYNHICVEISQAKMLEDVQQELTNTQRDFRLTIEQYELIREKGSYVTFEWDIEDDWIRLSKEWEDYFDQPRDISNFSQYIKSLKLLPWDQKELLISCMEDVKKGVAYQEHELLLPLKSGDTGWFELRVITQKNDQDEPVFGIGMLSDITERKEKINQLEKEIQMDLFTGLLNKAAIERYGARKLAELQKDEFLAILIIDLDDFKNINDGYGHPVGDYVLKQVAGIMRAKAPVGARVGRIGGDEFMALLVTKDLSVFQEYAHQLIREVPKIRWNEQDIGVWCSMGLAAADSSQWTYFQLYQKADDALYEAKRLGKNRLICDL